MQNKKIQLSIKAGRQTIPQNCSVSLIYVAALVWVFNLSLSGLYSGYLCHKSAAF